MALELIVSAGYQKAGTLLKVSVNGTYGWKLSGAYEATLSFTLFKLNKTGSPEAQPVSLLLEPGIPVRVETNGSIIQKGASAAPVIYSKRISYKAWKGALVIAGLYKGSRLVATASAAIQ